MMGFGLILCSGQESRTPMGAAPFIGSKERADRQLSARRMMEKAHLDLFCSRYEGEYLLRRPANTVETLQLYHKFDVVNWLPACTCDYASICP